MTEIERLANLAVWRGVGFASLAIGTAMMGSAFDLGLAMRLGAIGSLLLSSILYLKAETFHRRPVTETEVWIMLRPERRPPPDVAQPMIVRAMRAELLDKACYALAMGSAMLSIAALIFGASLLAGA